MLQKEVIKDCIGKKMKGKVNMEHFRQLINKNMK